MLKKTAGGANPHGLVEVVANPSYQAATQIATNDIGSWQSIGELSHEIVLACFVAKYNIKPALGRTIHELAGFAREAA